MTGRIQELIDQLVARHAGDDRGLMAAVKIKLIMKGVDPDLFNAESENNPLIIQRIFTVAKEMGIELD